MPRLPHHLGAAAGPRDARSRPSVGRRDHHLRSLGRHGRVRGHPPRARGTRRSIWCINLQVYFKAGIVTAIHACAGEARLRPRAGARPQLAVHDAPHSRARPVGQHVQDQYFEFLEALGVSARAAGVGPRPWPDELAWRNEFFAKLDRPAAAIVVATSKPEKDWMPGALGGGRRPAVRASTDCSRCWSAADRRGRWRPSR